MTEAQKAEKEAADAERLRKIQRTANGNIERLGAMAARRIATGAARLAAEAFRKSTRRKNYPQKIDEKVEKARAKAERRSALGTEFLAVEAARLSSRLKIYSLTVEQKAKKVVADAVRYRCSCFARSSI